MKRKFTEKDGKKLAAFVKSLGVRVPPAFTPAATRALQRFDGIQEHPEAYLRRRARRYFKPIIKKWGAGAISVDAILWLNTITAVRLGIKHPPEGPGLDLTRE